MTDDLPPTLLYHAQQPVRRSNWPAWVVAIATGCPAGYLLSFSAYGIMCAGVLFGFIVGAGTSFAAGSHKLVMGVVGNLFVVVTCFVCVTIANARIGLHSSAQESVMIALLLLVIVVVPGIIGSALVVSATRPAA